jgi:hypothetical protein
MEKKVIYIKEKFSRTISISSTVEALRRIEYMKNKHENWMKHYLNYICND